MYVIFIPMSSSGHFDYVPVNQIVSFEGSQTYCVNIQIVDDRLTESDEKFYVDVVVGSSKFLSLRVIIQDSEYSTM